MDGAPPPRNYAGGGTVASGRRSERVGVRRAGQEDIAMMRGARGLQMSHSAPGPELIPPGLSASLPLPPSALLESNGSGARPLPRRGQEVACVSARTELQCPAVWLSEPAVAAGGPQPRGPEMRRLGKHRPGASWLPHLRDCVLGAPAL